MMKISYTILSGTLALMMAVSGSVTANNFCKGRVEAVTFSGDGRFDITINAPGGEVIPADVWGKRSTITFRLDMSQETDVLVGTPDEIIGEASVPEIVNWLIEAHRTKDEISFLWAPADEQWHKLGKAAQTDVVVLRIICVNPAGLKSIAQDSGNTLIERVRTIDVPPLAFRSAAVGEVISQLMEMTGVNLLLDPRCAQGLDGSAGVTVNFRTVNTMPLLDMLEIVLDPIDFGCQINPSYIWITSNEILVAMESRTVTRQYKLKYGTLERKPVKLREYKKRQT